MPAPFAPDAVTEAPEKEIAKTLIGAHFLRLRGEECLTLRQVH
jgi:hypothetical protein